MTFPRCGMRESADTRDQHSREQRRTIHAQEVPLDDACAVSHAQPAADRGNRRRRHQEHHDDAAHGRVDQRRPVLRPGKKCGHNDAPGWGPCCIPKVSVIAIERQEQQRHPCQSRHGQIGPRKEGISEPGPAPVRKRGAGQRSDQPARQHIGNGPRLLGFGNGIGRGKPIILRKSLPDADTEGPQCKAPEHPLQHRPDGDQPAKRPEGCSDHESRLTPEPLHQACGTPGRERGPQGDEREWQCREPRLGSELIVDETGQGQVN